MSEKDIEIVTLADSKLQIFSPPSNISQTKNFIPLTPNLIRNPFDYNNPERTNFIFSSKIEYLGSGGFSKVYKYRGDIENKAVKKIIADPKYYSKSLTAVDSIKREVYGMTKIKCENSLKVYGVFQNKEKNTFFILMELCDGNMEKYIKDRGYPLNIDELLILLIQLNKAFHLLDTNNIIHRDIKPSNILYKEIKDNQKYKIKRLFGGSKLVFKLGDYGVCLPLYKENFSKSQFMGTMDFMAPEIYKMKTEKEHPTYTKKIDLFALGQSILCLMGFIKKAEPLTEELVDDLKKKCNLFNGKKKEKLLADLIFNHLLIFDPDKRDDWNKYLEHPFFDQENFSYNYFENENKSFMDKNTDRITKRIIIRNIKDINKNNEPKNKNNNSNIDKNSKKSLIVNKITMKKKQVSDKKEERKNKEINVDKVNKKPNIINKNNTHTVITLKQKGYMKSTDFNNKSPRISQGNLGVKYNSNIKSELKLRKKNDFNNKENNKINLLDNNKINNKKNGNKSIKKASNNNININKSNKNNKSNKSNKNILNARNSIIKITNLDNKNNNTNRVNKYSLTAGQNKIIPSNRYSTGKLNRVNMVNSVSGPFDLTNFNIEKKKTFDYQKIKSLLENNKTYNNNYDKSHKYTNNISLELKNENFGNNKRKLSYMDGSIKIINFYDTINNYDSNNLKKSTSNYNTNITNINFDSIRNRYKFIHFLQKQRNRNSGDISDASISQENSIKKQKSVMVNSRYENKNNNDIKKTSTIRFINYNNNCKNYKSNYNSCYNNHIINKSINLSQIQSHNKSISNTFNENNQKRNLKQSIELSKPKFIFLGELNDKKQKCICGCEDNFDNLKFNNSPDFKYYQMGKNSSYNNISKADNINGNHSKIYDLKEKYNNYKKNEKGKNNNYINIKSIELKEGLKRNKNTEFYYSKYSKTKNNI